jgi:hypothetical protein
MASNTEIMTTHYFTNPEQQAAVPEGWEILVFPGVIEVHEKVYPFRAIHAEARAGQDPFDVLLRAKEKHQQKGKKI